MSELSRGRDQLSAWSVEDAIALPAPIANAWKRCRHPPFLATIGDPMSTAEIIAELPRLTRAELAQVQARLAELTAPLPVAVSAPPGWPPRIRSPRLVAGR
jgi:hypothetical protein